MYLGMIRTAQNILDDLCNGNQLQHARTFQGNYPNVRWPVHPKDFEIFWWRRIICLRLLDLPLGEQWKRTSPIDFTLSIFLLYDKQPTVIVAQIKPCKNNRAIHSGFITSSIISQLLRCYVNTSVLFGKRTLHTFNVTETTHTYGKISKTFCSCLLWFSDIHYHNRTPAVKRSPSNIQLVSDRMILQTSEEWAHIHQRTHNFFFWFDFSRLRRVIYGNNPLIMRFKPKARSYPDGDILEKVCTTLARPTLLTNDGRWNLHVLSLLLAQENERAGELIK